MGLKGTKSEAFQPPTVRSIRLPIGRHAPNSSYLHTANWSGDSATIPPAKLRRFKSGYKLIMRLHLKMKENNSKNMRIKKTKISAPTALIGPTGSCDPFPLIDQFSVDLRFN